ncbi:FAD-dependent oxidoreductase [Candidatus Pelagibacter sp.]|nr:FAD-dependent oxidoreductase [Candidatus Pelagibacter sp.]
MFQKKIKSLDKFYSADIFIKRPDKYREIENICLNADSLITMGSANSYTAASFKKNCLSVRFEKFDRIINFSKEKKTITVEGGIKISDFLNFTLKHKLWVPQIPGYPSITIGGAVATNAHGKSCGFHGNIKNQIRKILIFHKVHGWLNLSKNENKEIFELTIGGFGLTGTIVNVEFKLLDFLGYNFTTSIENSISAKDTVEKININGPKEIYSYSWNRTDSKHNFGKGFIFKNELNPNHEKKIYNEMNFQTKKIHNYYPLNLWNQFSIRLFHSLYFNYYKNIKKKNFDDSFNNVIFPFIGKEIYFHMFGKKGFLESQILVPSDKTDIFLDELEYLFRTEMPCITLFTIKKMVGEQNYLRFENNGMCFTFDFINNKKNLLFMDKLDSLCKKYKFLPSIIKDSRLNLETVKECYKDYDNFKDDLFKFDKKRNYRSELSDRLGL